MKFYLLYVVKLPNFVLIFPRIFTELKNRTMKFLLPILCLFLFSCQNSPSNNTPTNNPNKEEWISLFNGKDLNDWIIKIAGEPLNGNYKNTFRANDGILEINYDEYENFDDKYGHMYYKTPYSYYKLKFDYRFTGDQVPGGEVWNVRNSGIMVHSQSAEDQEPGQHFPVSIEVQLLGGLGEEKGDRTTANLCTPGTAVVMGDTVNYTHCINSTSKTYHGDQWVSVEAVVYGDSLIEHKIDDKIVLAYEKPQLDAAFINRAFKGQDYERFGVTKVDEWLKREGELLFEGYIALQAESHPIDFKNLELLNLKGCMDKKAKNYKSYFVKADNSSCLYD